MATFSLKIETGFVTYQQAIQIEIGLVRSSDEILIGNIFFSSEEVQNKGSCTLFLT